MADEHDIEAFIMVALCLHMDLGDQRAGGVDLEQLALAGRLRD